MPNENVKIIYDERQIADAVECLAAAISRDYAGREVVLVGCLTGAFVFMADLIRKLEIPVTCDFIRVASYRDATTAGQLVLEADLRGSVEGRHVIVVEDIVDTGATVRYVTEHLEKKGAASVDLCALVYKESKRATVAPSTIRYLGLTVPDVFIVGYGIDYAQKYRYLPYMGAISKS